MKLYMDNELKDGRKVVSMQYNNLTHYELFEVMLDALRVYGICDEELKDCMIATLLRWMTPEAFEQEDKQ